MTESIPFHHWKLTRETEERGDRKRLVGIRDQGGGDLWIESATLCLVVLHACCLTSSLGQITKKFTSNARHISTETDIIIFVLFQFILYNLRSMFPSILSFLRLEYYSII